MSYVDRIPEAKKASYRVVADWNHYYNEVKADYNKRVEKNKNFSFRQFEKIIFDCGVVFSGLYEHKMQFEDCYFKKGISFTDGVFENEVFIRNCYIQSGINLKEPVFKDSFHLVDLSVTGSVNVNGGDFQKYSWWGFQDNPELYFRKGTFSDLQVGSWGGGSKIKLLNIDCDRLEGRITLVHPRTTINKLLISGIANKLVLSVEQINVNDFQIVSFRNNAVFRLSGIKAVNNANDNSKFCVLDSNLGKTELYNIDFRVFHYFTIVESVLIDSLFVNVKWKYCIHSGPIKHRYDYSKDDYDRNQLLGLITVVEKYQLAIFFKVKKTKQFYEYFENSRETYRQLKYALGKQGDIINEQRFHIMEMVSYYNSIDWKNNFWNKAIVLLSYHTSNFGQSMWWPIRALLIGHTLFFLIAMLTGLSSVHISFVNASWSALNTAVYEYFNFINPLHKVEEEHQNWTIIIDIFMRIWSSYMIYNIIRASRRFIK